MEQLAVTGNTMNNWNRFFTIAEAADFLRIGRTSMFGLIRNGTVRTVKLSSRMVRITLDQLLNLAAANGYEVIIPEAISKAIETSRKAQYETGSKAPKAKCRKTPKAGSVAPEGVTHDTHYTMAEVLRIFDLKYGRLYEIRNRYKLESVHAWGTTCFEKKAVEEAVNAYNEEQGRNLREDWYSCADIMKLYGLGKTQVRRFANTHGVRTKVVQGGQALYYLKADWDSARRKCQRNNPTMKRKRQ